MHGCQWFTPVIPAIQEAEIRKMEVQSQPRQIIQETLSQKKKHHKKGLAKWPSGSVCLVNVRPEFKLPVLPK
jgi:hypothetical protein